MPTDSKKHASFRRRHKLAGQSAAFVLMMSAPLLMYQAALADAAVLVTIGLGIMAASMALAMWVS
jgi:hypothetical protein